MQYLVYDRDCRERGIELTAHIKTNKFIDQLSDYQLANLDSALRIYLDNYQPTELPDKYRIVYKCVVL